MTNLTNCLCSVAPLIFMPINRRSCKSNFNHFSIWTFHITNPRMHFSTRKRKLSVVSFLSRQNAAFVFSALIRNASKCSVIAFNCPSNRSQFASNLTLHSTSKDLANSQPVNIFAQSACSTSCFLICSYKLAVSSFSRCNFLLYRSVRATILPGAPFSRSSARRSAAEGLRS